MASVSVISKPRPSPETDSYKSNDSKLRIFVSHKLNDSEVAQTVRDKLRFLAGNPDRIEIHTSNECEWGEDWFDRIHTLLSEADWLLLLYTDPTIDWDWCLYETGFYSGKRFVDDDAQTSADRLIVIHNPETDIPEVLSRWKPVPAKSDTIWSLIQQIFKTVPHEANSAIRPDIDKYREESQPAIDSILKMFGASTSTNSYTDCLKIHLTPEQSQRFAEERRLPDDAKVRGDAPTLQIFGLANPDGTTTWRRVLDELSEGQTQWVADLEERLARGLGGGDLLPGLSYFVSENKRVYRPVFHRLTRRFNGSCDIRILLLQIGQDILQDETSPHPHIRIEFQLGKGLYVRTASPDAETLFGLGPVSQTAGDEFVTRLAAKLKNEQTRPFLEEQRKLIFELVSGGQPRATVPLVFADRPDEAYLPVITRYGSIDGALNADVLYFDVSNVVTKDANDVARFNVSTHVAATPH